MPTILVIEDTAELRDEVLLMLEFEGYHAIGASDGVTGIRLARAHQPDLILCDILMPGLDGYATITAIRQEPALAETPFVFLTALADWEERQQGIGLGACDYLTKPCTFAELRSVINRCLGCSTAR